LRIADKPAIECQKPSKIIMKAAKYVHPTAHPLRFSDMRFPSFSVRPHPPPTGAMREPGRHRARVLRR
jgi:hypothetical protein